MSRAETSTNVTVQQARRLLIRAQGLSGNPSNSVVASVQETGFVRTLGGVDVYLAVRARVPGMTREDLERAVEAGDLQVKPAARGCIYLVPRRLVSICLRFADLRTRTRAAREHEKAGIRPGEVEQVADAVVDVLQAQGSMTTDAIRRALPEGLVRGLGAAGKKVGISSPLPPALRLLEFSGRVERRPEGGRLDTERYLWRLPSVNPFEEFPAPDEPDALNAKLAAVFFRAAGLATLKAFADWAGTSQRDARQVLSRLELAPIQVADRPEPYYLLESRLSWLDEAPEDARPSLIPFEDNLIACQGGLELLVDAAYHDLRLPVWGRGNKQVALADAKHASLRSLVANGGIVGFWEYDPQDHRIEHRCFAAVDNSARRGLEAAAEDTARFLSEQLGHGRSVALDTDKALSQRVAGVHKL